MFFLTPNMFTGKFVKWERFSAVLREHIISDVKWIEVRNMSEVFWAKLYFKISDLLSTFCWLWHFLLENLKSKKTLMISTGTCGRILYSCMPKIIFSKKEFPIWDFESLIFWLSFVFHETALGRFSQSFFVVGQPWWPTFLLNPTTTTTTTIKKSFLRPCIFCSCHA